MIEHKNIQDPDAYNEEDYIVLEHKLLSPDTSTEELEEICMTLAHLPTKEAQELLEKFRQSDRADEVGWLQCAIDEGRFHYLSPTNEQEERDYLALKVLQEMEDQIVELETEYSGYEIELNKLEIEHEAVAALVKKGEIDENEEILYQDRKTMIESKMEELKKDIETQEKIFDQIKQSIKSEKYKDIDPMYMSEVVFF